MIPGSGRSAGEGIGYPVQYSWASLVAQLVKNLPAMQETWVQSLDWEDPLEKGKATHSSILVWRIPYSPWGRKEPDTTDWLSLAFLTLLSPLQLILMYINLLYLPLFNFAYLFFLFFPLNIFVSFIFAALFPSWHLVFVLFSSLGFS